MSSIGQENTEADRLIQGDRQTIDNNNSETKSAEESFERNIEHEEEQMRSIDCFHTSQMPSKHMVFGEREEEAPGRCEDCNGTMNAGSAGKSVEDADTGDEHAPFLICMLNNEKGIRQSKPLMSENMYSDRNAIQERVLIVLQNLSTN